jgi:hypothetical protein
VVASIPAPVGGTIVPGLYELRSWEATSACASQIQNAFRLTATGTNTFRFDSHQIGNGQETVTTATLTVNGTEIDQTFICGYTLSQTFSYSATVSGSVTELDFMFPGLLYAYIRVGD